MIIAGFLRPFLYNAFLRRQVYRWSREVTREEAGLESTGRRLPAAAAAVPHQSNRRIVLATEALLNAWPDECYDKGAP